MVHEIIHKIPPDELTMQVLHSVRELLPYFTVQETRGLLDALCAKFTGEVSWQDSVTGRHREYYRQIADTSEYAVLAAAHTDLNNLEMERFLKIESVPTVHASCTEYRDLLARRTLSLVEEELAQTGSGRPQVPYALVSMGSDGREEQTLITDQDYLIVYADGGGEEADSYFKAYAELLVERMAEIGFKKCTGDIMPSNPTWRGSFTQWRKKLLAIMRYEYEDYGKNLMDLIVLSDARYVGGDATLAHELVELIRGLEQDYFQVLWGMAKAASEMKLALGFLKRLWTEGPGDHKGEFNLKLLAWAPLVMNVRILSINQGIKATSTLGRIEQLEKERSFSRITADGLTDAYHILTRHRIFLQIKNIKGIQKDSYYLNPYELAADERERIRQALLRIEELQKMIHTNFNIV